MNNVFAQQLTLPGNGAKRETISGPPGFDFANSKIGDVVGAAVPYVFGFAGLALLLILIRAGYTFLTSAGDAKKLEMGKQQLTYALVGFLIIFSSFWIVTLVGTILGFEEITGVFQ